MKKLLLFLAVLLAIGYYFGKPYIAQVKEAGTYKGSVRRRVNFVLDGWKKGGTEDTNVVLTAACYWCKGTIQVSMDEMTACTNAFDAFRREKDLLRKIATYEVVEIFVTESTTPPSADVSLSIDGRPYRWSVTENEPITWAQR